MVEEQIEEQAEDEAVAVTEAETAVEYDLHIKPGRKM